MAEQPLDEPPMTAVINTVLSLVRLWQDRQAEGRVRHAVISSSPALTARERAKHEAHERILVDGLTARGLAEPPARLLARVAIACVAEAVSRWFADVDPTAPGLEARTVQTFAELAQALAGTLPSAEPDSVVPAGSRRTRGQ